MSPPMRRSNLSDVHTRSHTKVGSEPSSDLRFAPIERSLQCLASHHDADKRR